MLESFQHIRYSWVWVRNEKCIELACFASVRAAVGERYMRRVYCLGEKIRDAGAQAVAQVLKWKHTVTQLYLSGMLWFSICLGCCKRAI